jgi:small-conductance mechanosensitive channel
MADACDQARPGGIVLAKNTVDRHMASGSARVDSSAHAREYLRVTVLTVVVGLCAVSEIRAQAPPMQEAEVDTASVEIDGRVLFRVRGVSSLPAEVRARRIVERVESIAADPSISVDAVRPVPSGGMTQILAGPTVIMAVVDADASLEQVGQPELAEAHVRTIRQAIADYRAARTSEALQTATTRAVTATVIAIATVAVLALLGRRVDRLLASRLRGHVKTVGIQSFEVMRADQILTGVRSALFAVRTGLLLAIGLVNLGYVLAQFPWTRGLSRNMTTFALAPLAVIGNGLFANLPSLVFLVVLYFFVRFTLRLVRLFFDAIGRGTVTLPNFFPEWAAPTYKIIRIAIVAFALVVAYPYIPGSGTAAFQGVSLFIGIVFSLGSSSAIANIIAGYMLTYRRALKVGDRVKIGDAVGDVIEMRLQVTHLRSLKNEEITIPNSQILAGDVVNYSSLATTHGLILHTEVGIGYETPWRQVEAMLLEAAGRTSGLSPERHPFVLQKRLGDFAVTYELNVYCTTPDQMTRLYTALHGNILDVFNEYGVQIMTPAYEGDPEVPKVVAPKDWYAAPATAPEPTRTLRENTVEAVVTGHG